MKFKLPISVLLFLSFWFVNAQNSNIQIYTPAGAKKNELFQKENSHLYGGIGLRFIHKFINSVTLRIDSDFSLNDPSKRGIVFGIGQYF